jgi:hypothetical protein
MMGSNVIFFAWNRSVPGFEQQSAAHFQEFVQYLQTQKEDGMIQSYEPVLLDPHGGDMNGFFLIRGETNKLDTLMSTDAWESHMTRGAIHLHGPGVTRGVTGDRVMKRMELWKSLVLS